MKNVKKTLYLASGLALVFLSIIFFYFGFALLAGFSQQNFFLQVHPFGALVIAGVLAIAGFYFLKIGITAMKNYFE